MGRVVQASGSAATLSLARTVIHDVYGSQHAGRALAQLTTAMIFVPMFAPALGGTLLDHVGWRAVFGACLAFGIVAFTLLARYLPESSDARMPRLGLKQAVANYAALVRTAITGHRRCTSPG